MAIKEIKLIQDAYICGYEGAFCHEVSEDGKCLATGVANASQPEFGTTGMKQQPKMSQATSIRCIG